MFGLVDFGSWYIVAKSEASQSLIGVLHPDQREPSLSWAGPDPVFLCARRGESTESENVILISIFVVFYLHRFFLFSDSNRDKQYIRIAVALRDTTVFKMATE
jgi:hypothetical protein